MSAKPCQDMSSVNNQNVKNYSQFELSKAVYTSGILNKVKLTPTSKLVLFALAQHYNPNKADMFPSKDFLSNQLGISPRSVGNAICELRQKGLIIYETKKVNRYKFTSIFFNHTKIADQPCKKEQSNHANFAHKQIKEQKNNKSNFSKTSNFNDYKQRKYHHNNQQTGINYQTFKPEKIEKSSPMDYTKEQAIEYLNNLPSFLDQSKFAKELRVKWSLKSKLNKQRY